MDANDWQQPEQRTARAREFIEQRDFESALRELRALEADNPFDPEMLLCLGQVCEALRRDDDAIDAYQRRLELLPTDVPTLGALALAQRRSGRLYEAIKSMERATRLDADYEPSYCVRASIYAEIGLASQVEELFYLARLVRDECPRCYEAMGLAKAELGAWDKAIWCWTRALELPPEPDVPRARLHRRIAEASWCRHDLEQARRHYLRALALEGDRVDLLLDLGELLLELNRLDEAHARIRRALQLQPESPKARFAIGRLLLRQGEFDAGIASCQLALKMDPTLPLVHLAIGEALLRVGRLDEAAAHLRREMALHPRRVETLLDLSNLLIDAGELVPARTCLSRATVLGPRDHRCWQNLAVVECMLGNFEDGLDAARRALRLNPNSPELLHNLALAEMRNGLLDLARAHVDQGLSIDPNHVPLRRLRFHLRLRRWRRRLLGWMGRG
jgi:tetratricopeptide (TPR) repeat protein